MKAGDSAAPDGGPGRLLVPQLQLENWTISQINFRSGIRGQVIEGQSLFDTGGGRPKLMTSGDFDGDGRRDLAAWLQIPDPDSAPSLGIGLATGVFGRAAMGLECRRLRVMVADIDGNGRDDIVTLGSDGCRWGSLLRVLLH